MMKTCSYILPALVLVAGCGGEQNSPVDMLGSTHSAFGINFMVPAARSMTVTNQKIELDTNAVIQTSDNIQLFIGENVNPDSAEVGVVDEGVFPAPYTVHLGSEGSGGLDYRLHTRKSVGAKTVQMIATVQAEKGQPSFSEAWAVWDSLAPAD